jgi:hypothetical protein
MTMIRSTGSISNTNVYLKYAEEALRWSYQAKTEHSKKAFLDLAHTWARAAKHPKHLGSKKTTRQCLRPCKAASIGGLVAEVRPPSIGAIGGLSSAEGGCLAVRCAHSPITGQVQPLVAGFEFSQWPDLKTASFLL